MNKLATAVVIGVIAWIIAYIVGTILLAIGVQPFVAAGAVLKDFAALIGIIAALLNYLTGRPSF